LSLQALLSVLTTALNDGPCEVPQLCMTVPLGLFF
jgi:hypothetical protein